MGPPGAGKSTLMKFVVNSEREARRDRDIIAAFFVHGRGTDMQKSHLGIYRSLLHQLLPYCPGPLAKLTKVFMDRTNIRGKFDKKWTWEEGELRNFFNATILAESLQRSITAFIDALDEMDEQSAVDLIANFERLQSKDIPRHSKFRLCFSCRYYPNLAKEGSLSIAVEKENARDINSLIKTHVAAIKFGLSDRETITNLIIERANGIFQWASLVLDDVKHLRRLGQPATAIISRIEKVPGTLKGIYGALLVFENEHDRQQTLKLFQWILFSFTYLSVEKLQQALAIDANMSHNTLEEINQSAYYYQLEDMPTVVQGLSKGLARVTKSHPVFVETIHQSVNDYLLQSGLEDLTQPLTGNPQGLAYFQLSRSYIGLLQIFARIYQSLEYEDKCLDEHESSEYKIEKSNVDSLVCRASQFPLATDAKFAWLECIIGVEQCEIDQQDLLERFPWRKHCGALPLIFTHQWQRSCVRLARRQYIHNADGMVQHLAAILCIGKPYAWDPVHLLALAGIHSALEKMEQEDPDIYSRMDFFGHPTLMFALAGGNEKIIASAMRILANNHVRNESFRISPLFLAVNHGREDWVQAIINEGADLDQMNRNSAKWSRCTALYLAWLRRNDKIIRLLLSAGADPSIICSQGDLDCTAIHEALRATDQWSKNILLLLVESAINLYPKKKLPNLKYSARSPSTLSYAIEQGNVRLVQLLLDSGARQDCPGNVHVRDGEAFNTAARRGLEEIVKVLLNNRVDPSSSFFGKNPLYEAAANGHSSVVRLLLDVGARPIELGLDNEDTYSCLVALNQSVFLHTSHSSVSSSSRSLDPVKVALKNGHVSVVQAFLDVLNTPDADTKSQLKEIRSLPWESYLRLAVERNVPAVVQILLKSGLDPNTVAFGQMHLLLIAAKDGFGEIARMLLHYGADPTLTNDSGITPLQATIGYNHVEIMSMLLEWRDAHGRTLIMQEILMPEKVEWSPSWVIQQLLPTEYNFNVQDDKGLTALSYAVIENILEIVDTLLNHGRSDPNTQSLQGETPLMTAAAAGHESILQRLLAYPLTDIGIEDEDGLTAVDHARRAGHSTAVALLRKKEDELLAQRHNTTAMETLQRGPAWHLQTVVSTGMMGTLRWHPH